MVLFKLCQMFGALLARVKVICRSHLQPDNPTPLRICSMSRNKTQVSKRKSKLLRVVGVSESKELILNSLTVTIRHNISGQEIL